MTELTLPGSKITRPLYSPGKGPLPLVIGITGHPDPNPIHREKLISLVRTFFTEMRARYAHTPFLVLTSLGEGAESLAARGAVESGAHLIVLLPFPQEEYTRSFSTAEARQEFLQLLALSTDCINLGWVGDNNSANYREDGARLDLQYMHAAALIAHYSQILLALWNGLEKDASSQTERTVRYKRNGIPDHLTNLDALTSAESGMIYHIPTPRGDDPSVGDAALSAMCLYSSEDSVATAERAHERICQNIERFNMDALRLERRPELKGRQQRSRESLLGEENALALSPTLTAISECFCVADTLAYEFQVLSLRRFAILIGLVVVATGIFALYSNLSPLQEFPLLILAYPLLLGCTRWLRDYWEKQSDHQDRYQDYRVLSEGLRVQFYWSLIGLPDSVAGNYPNKQKPELEWLRSAIQVWSIFGSGVRQVAVPEPEPYQSYIRLIKERWIDGQVEYYRRAAAHNDRLAVTIERKVACLIGASVVLAALMALVLTVVHNTASREFYEGIHGYGMLLVNIPAIAAGALHYRAEKMAFAAHTKLYSKMRNLYTKAGARLEERLQKGQRARVEELLRHLGREALSEHGDWIALHRERPLEITSLN